MFVVIPVRLVTDAHFTDAVSGDPHPVTGPVTVEVGGRVTISGDIEDLGYFSNPDASAIGVYAVGGKSSVW